VSLINKIQRIDKGREVDLYHIVNGKPYYPEAALFPQRKEEFELAKLKVRDDQTGHAATVLVYLVQGRLFSIEFSSPPGDWQDIESLSIDIERIADPMISEPTVLPSSTFAKLE